MSNMTNWSKDSEGRLTNTFEFKNYRKSLAFTCEVAMLSEKKNHHPQIILNYGSVIISLISHDVQQVTQRDLDLADQIDKIYSK